MTQVTTSTPLVSDMTIANISKEQEDMMREWIISKMPTSMASYLDGINVPWDKNEVLLVNIKKMGYNDIIFRYEHDTFLEETVYKPYFKFNTLASKLGYNRPKDLFKTNGLLHGYDKYNVKNEAGIYRLAPGEGICVIPPHLIDISDTNKYNYIYVNMNACEALIMGASRQSKFKDKANEFKTLIDSLNKLSFFVAKLNQIIMSYKHLQSMKGTTSKPTTDISKEQEGMMREWVMSQLPTDTLPFFDGVTRPWDPVEFLTSNIMRYGFNEIIMVPTKNKLTGKTYYEPYFVIYKLAKYLHYTNPENTSKLFKNQILYTLSDLCKKYSSEIIVPNHLKTNQLNQMKFGNFKCAKQLIEHVAYSNVKSYAAGKQVATSLMDVMTDISVISKDLIDAMNQLVAEYRYQQQLTNAKANEQKLLQIEQYKKDIEDQRKRLEEETRLFALQAHPDIAIKKSHYGYIFSSEDYMKKDLYKIGITDNLKGREVAAHTYHPEGGFLYTIETYNAKVTEASLHQVLKDYRLQYKINSGDEWFKIPGLDEAKRLLDLAINNTGAVYEHVASYASQLRDRIINPPIQAIMPSSTSAINEEPPIADFIKDVIDKIGMDRYVYKTDLLKAIRTMTNDIRYKKHKTKLPTNVEMFTTSADTSGLKAEIKESGRVTRIRFIIEVDI